MDRKNVHNALLWLCQNNHYYRGIKLPALPEDLLPGDLNSTPEEPAEMDNDDLSVHNEKPWIERITAIQPGLPFLSLSDKWVIFCRFFVVVRRVFFAFVALSLFVAFAKILSLFGQNMGILSLFEVFTNHDLF